MHAPKRSDASPQRDILGLSALDYSELAAASRTYQGLAPNVINPRALRQVARLLGEAITPARSG